MFDVSNLVYIIPALVLAVGFHEAMHAQVAHWLGDTTASDLGRVTLSPLAHIDLVTTLLLPIGLIILGLPPIFVAKPVPFNPDRVKYDEFGAALVGAAGPLTNLVLAAIAAIFLRAVELPLVGFKFLAIFCGINVALFVFNMIPIPPLDGSRVLYAFAPEPLQKFMYQIESMGIMVVIIILIVLAPFIGPILINANDAILRLLLGPLY